MTNELPQETPSQDASDAPQSAPESGSSAVRSVISAAAALAAGGLAIAVMGALGELFTLPPEMRAMSAGRFPTAEEQEIISAERLAIDYRHATVRLGVYGVLLGLAVGTVNAGRATGIRGRLIGGLVGAGVCGVISAVAGAAAVAADQVAQANIPAGDLDLPEHFVMAVHAVTWLIVGLGAGLAVGLLRKSQGMAKVGEKIVVAGLAGLLAGALFPIIAGLALPATNAAVAFPAAEDLGGRILWMLFPSALIGGAAGR